MFLSFHVFFVFYAISNIFRICFRRGGQTMRGGGVKKTLLSHFTFSSRFMLFLWIFEILKNAPSLCSNFRFRTVTLLHSPSPNSSMQLNGRWFPQIYWNSGNPYPIYPPFPCSDFWSQGLGSKLVFRKTILCHFIFDSDWMCHFSFRYEYFFQGGGGDINTDIDTSPRVEGEGGVSFLTCWREISGDWIALLFSNSILYSICNKMLYVC